MKFYQLIAISLFVASCSKPLFPERDSGILLHNGTCWTISTVENVTYEPGLMRDFDLEPENGMRVTFRYRITNNPTMCQVGQHINLTSIKENK